MSATARKRDVSPPLAKDAARVPTTLPPPVDTRAAAERSPEAEPERSGMENPLWLIAIAMAVFFGITALLLMVDRS